MNDGNVRWYLNDQLNTLNMRIARLRADIKSREQKNDDDLQRINNYKIHYKSLLGTGIEYNLDSEDRVPIEQED